MPTRSSRLIRHVVYGTDWSKTISRPVRALPNRHIEELLARPSWSVRSLLPEYAHQTTTSKSDLDTSENRDQNSNPSQTELEITREKLHHLLRLSALPLPKSPAEESHLLSTLKSQIHFVRSIQSVDTTDVQPLVAIRDETPEAIAEQTVHVKDLKPWFDLEEKVGRNGTLRRRKTEKGSKEGKISTDGTGEGWDPFKLGAGCEEGSGRRMGRWFVVKKARSVEKKEEGRQGLEEGKMSEVEPG